MKTQASADDSDSCVFDALDRKKNDSTLAAAVTEASGTNSIRQSGGSRPLSLRTAGTRHALVEAVRTGRVTTEEIPAAEIARLRQSRDTTVAEAVATLFPICGS
jgi:hypothetical protein